MDDLGFHVRPDSLDFRDRIFQPTLVEVPTEVPLERYKAFDVPILDQLAAWMCTGFALATVVHYLMRRRTTHPDYSRVSPGMLFEMARRYDDYPGEDYLGSSARGAMKGWHLHGVCAETLWPFDPKRRNRRLDAERVTDAATRPLGAYFRVNHKDLVTMHCALAEVGVLFAVANVHKGWRQRAVRADGTIPPSSAMLGSHAVAIVAYNRDGFWIQNSWGTRWGLGGLGFLSYDDWLENGVDAWVARLGVPTHLDQPRSAARITASASTSSRSQAARYLRPHLVRIHPDGFLQSNDVFGTSVQDLDTIFNEDFPKITSGWKKKRLVLYAGGGLVPLGATVQRGVADYRASLLGQEIYPLVFVWRIGFWDTIGAVIRRALSLRQADADVGSELDFLLDRLDDGLEPLIRQEGGKLHWDEVKRTAQQATAMAEGAVRLTLQRVAALVKQDPSVEVHVIAHSAGAILLAPAVQLLTSKGRISSGPMNGRRGLGVSLGSCVLWAPACTTDLFHRTYFPSIFEGRIRRFMLFTLSDRAERADHCAAVYRKSLLYLISNALEAEPRVPDESPEESNGAEILGMEKFVRKYADDNPQVKQLLRRKSVQWIVSPGTSDPRVPLQATARRHGDFDDDEPTLVSTLSGILDQPLKKVQFAIHRSASSSRQLRKSLERRGVRA